jgi:hypothetical protein
VHPVPTGEELLDKGTHGHNQATPLGFAKDAQTAEHDKSPGSGDLPATLFVNEELGLEFLREDNGLAFTTVQHRWKLGHACAIGDGSPVYPGALSDLGSARSALASVDYLCVDGLRDNEDAHNLGQEV